MGYRGSVTLFFLCLCPSLTSVMVPIAGYAAEKERKARQECQQGFICLCLPFKQEGEKLCDLMSAIPKTLQSLKEKQPTI